MSQLQVLAATSTPILQRFARFFTDILHESCRAIIINTAVGLFPDAVIAPLAIAPSLPLMSPAELSLPPPLLEQRSDNISFLLLLARVWRRCRHTHRRTRHTSHATRHTSHITRPP